MALRGGISMPQAAPVEEGTALLSNDLETLMLPPGEVGTAFASVLQGGTGVEQAKLFDLTAEPLLENYGLAYAQKVQQDLEASGQQSMVFSDTVSQGEQRPTALSTGVGGALVATTLIEQRTLDSAGGRYKPEATGLVTALSGLSGQQDRIVQEIAHQILFFVPSKSDDGAKIQVLGVSSELVGARN
ncbi:hypothetical protein [Leucobacter insecticola]|uniref:hypothetical protein n=1 Tax=Leucobacter insecticola TaxID=2714934 RepID=UPI001FCBB23D|nr:hypothetical protein [Leucobacter insecticola]